MALIKLLLKRKICDRLSSFSTIAAQPFLSGIDPRTLLTKTYRAPFIPQPKTIKRQKKSNNTQKDWMSFFACRRLDLCGSDMGHQPDSDSTTEDKRSTKRQKLGNSNRWKASRFDKGLIQRLINP